MIEAVKALAGQTENMLMTFLGANLALSIVSAGFLQYLWGMLNTMQIIVLTSLFEIDVHMNA